MHPDEAVIPHRAAVDEGAVAYRDVFAQNDLPAGVAVEHGVVLHLSLIHIYKAQGKNPFTLTSKAVDAEKYQALLANETRYSRLTRAFPDRAKQLFARNEQVANDRYEHLTRLVELYK